jgi:hypothetical protein
LFHGRSHSLCSNLLFSTSSNAAGGLSSGQSLLATTAAMPNHQQTLVGIETLLLNGNDNNGHFDEHMNNRCAFNFLINLFTIYLCHWTFRFCLSFFLFFHL